MVLNLRSLHSEPWLLQQALLGPQVNRVTSILTTDDEGALPTSRLGNEVFLIYDEGWLSFILCSEWERG